MDMPQSVQQGFITIIMPQNIIKNKNVHERSPPCTNETNHEMIIL